MLRHVLSTVVDKYIDGLKHQVIAGISNDRGNTKEGTRLTILILLCGVFECLLRTKKQSVCFMFYVDLSPKRRFDFSIL